MGIDTYLSQKFRNLLGGVDEEFSPSRYRILKRKIAGLMALVSLVPLLLMAFINFQQYQSNLSREILNPLRALIGKTKNSMELFLAERTSTVSFMAAAYTFQELSDEKTLKRIFHVMREKFDGFVDLGLIDSRGIQVNYVGPYNLQGRDYSEQPWFKQVVFRGKYVSDVFLGFRDFPHLVIAVQHLREDGEYWVLRATIDTKQFDRILAAMGIEQGSDAFLVNRAGVLQSNSNFYGKILDKLPMDMPPVTFETQSRVTRDPVGRDVFLAYSFFPDSDFALMAVKPRDVILRPWYSLRLDLAFIFMAGLALILLAANKLTENLIRRLRESDERRELALRQVEHTQKLSSIGRLAAGVAHEINNPLAIINEKAGLMKDILAMRPETPDAARFVGLIDAIHRAVERCRGITHRMLGFARQMDVKIESLDVNEVLRETAAFLEKEATYRNVALTINLDDDLPRIDSDRGQLQQVFLNILSNAFAAVKDGGHITLVSFKRDAQTVGLSIQDDGVGMSDETLKHIFEPFFTTKKGSGGTGLGLSITYGIVKRLGGEINVQSTPGQGTTFTVFLPHSAPAAEVRQ